MSQEDFEMTVKRLSTGQVDPPLDMNWDDLTKLRWWAALANLDTGHTVKVARTHGRTKGRHFWNRWKPMSGYTFSYDSASEGSYDFWEAWTWLNGFSAGARRHGF